MKLALRVVGGLVGILFLIYGIGLFLPSGHVAAVSATYASPPPSVWAAIADFERMPEWNSAITAMEPRVSASGREFWLARGEGGDLPTVVVESEPPRRLVTEVDGGVFRGSWTYEIDRAGDGTRVTITERGEIPFPLFRWFSVFSDHHATARAYLSDLGAHFGETVEPVNTR